MSCWNFSLVFLTTPSNVWVSFNQIQNMIEIAKINEDTKAIALVSELIFADIWNHRLTHMNQNVLPKLQVNVPHYPKWVSFNQIQNMIEIAEIIEDTKAIALVSDLIFADISNHRLTHITQNVLPKILLSVPDYPK